MLSSASGGKLQVNHYARMMAIHSPQHAHASTLAVRSGRLDPQLLGAATLHRCASQGGPGRTAGAGPAPSSLAPTTLTGPITWS